MKILILGGDGMLGHQMLRTLSRRHEVRVTLRRPLAEYAAFGLFDRDNAFDAVDARSLDAVLAVLAAFRPEAVINAVGIVKQRPVAAEAVPGIEVNSLLPHRLALACSAAGCRLIHFSTDCVFSGLRGGYSESDIPDPVDLYGRTKLLGEVSEAPALTLRTSIIGRELGRRQGLLEWFLAQKGPVRGWTRAVFSGLTTLEVTRVVERILLDHPHAAGLWHLSGPAIAKYDLLALAGRIFGHGIAIEPDDRTVIDRSLDSGRFRAAFGWQPPSWEQMLTALAAEPRP